MVRSEIIKKVRSTVIQTKKALSGSRAGEFKTRFYGSGYDFDQLRDYQQGDDVRFIDWKSSARANKTLLREYKDERSRTTHILIDVSRSMLYGSRSLRIYDVMRELVIACLVMGEATDDAVGLHFFTDKLELSIPPRSGKKQSARLIHELFNHTHSGIATSLNAAFEQFGKRYRQKSLVIVISDFIDESYEQMLHVLGQWHEVAVVRISDTDSVQIMQACSGIFLEDSEQGPKLVLEGAAEYAQLLQQRRIQQDKMFQRHHVPCCNCTTEGYHIEQLVAFLHRYF